eukprot:g50133.t1
MKKQAKRGRGREARKPVLKKMDQGEDKARGKENATGPATGSFSKEATCLVHASTSSCEEVTPFYAEATPFRAKSTLRLASPTSSSETAASGGRAIKSIAFFSEKHDGFGSLKTPIAGAANQLVSPFHSKAIQYNSRMILCSFSLRAAAIPDCLVLVSPPAPSFF